jgi:hypothetical protein
MAFLIPENLGSRSGRARFRPGGREAPPRRDRGGRHRLPRCRGGRGGRPLDPRPARGLVALYVLDNGRRSFQQRLKEQLGPEVSFPEVYAAPARPLSRSWHGWRLSAPRPSRPWPGRRGVPERQAGRPAADRDGSVHRARQGGPHPDLDRSRARADLQWASGSAHGSRAAGRPCRCRPSDRHP